MPRGLIRGGSSSLQRSRVTASWLLVPGRLVSASYSSTSRRRRPLPVSSTPVAAAAGLSALLRGAGPRAAVTEVGNHRCSSSRLCSSSSSSSASAVAAAGVQEAVAAAAASKWAERRRWLRHYGPALLLNFGNVCALTGFLMTDVLWLRAFSMIATTCGGGQAGRQAGAGRPAGAEQ